MINEEDLTDQLLLDTVYKLYKNKDSYIAAMENSGCGDAVKTITELLLKACR